MSSLVLDLINYQYFFEFDFSEKVKIKLCTSCSMFVIMKCSSKYHEKDLFWDHFVKLIH